MALFDIVHTPSKLVALTSSVRTDLVEVILSSDGFQSFIKSYNVALTAVLGICTILIIVLLFVNITKLSASADNDYRRREAINGILTCLICLAIVGGIDTVYAILLSFVFGA